MAQINERKLEAKRGWHGPDHDPWMYDESIVHQNGDTIILHAGMAYYVSVNGKKVAEAPNPWNWDELAEVNEKFKELTGMTVFQFQEAYERLHPHHPANDLFYGEA